MGTKDAAVNTEDLLKAGKEISASAPDRAAARMRELEPVVVQYIEASADQIAGRLASTATKIEDVRRIAAEVRKIGFVIMRAQQLGYHRLWANAFLDEPPLSQLKEPSPENGSKNEQKNG